MTRIKQDGWKVIFRFKGDDRKKLLFLYGKGFMWDKPKDARIKRVLEMLDGNADVSERFMRIIETIGDADMMDSEEKQTTYQNHVVALKRYFHLAESFGFLENMDDAKFYFELSFPEEWKLLRPSSVRNDLLSSSEASGEEETKFRIRNINVCTFGCL